MVEIAAQENSVCQDLDHGPRRTCRLDVIFVTNDRGEFLSISVYLDSISWEFEMDSKQ